MSTVKFHNLSEQVQQYAQSYFNSHNDNKIVFHNITHTLDVVAATTRIANHYQLNDKDFFIVYTAAWFHDMGYCTDPAHHEEIGSTLAEKFLISQGVDEDAISVIKMCILATQIPHHPANLLEQIICDADLFHLGTDEFQERNKLMRSEAEMMYGKEIPKNNWRKNTIQLLESHHYFTDYCRLMLDEKKKENLEMLKKKDQGKRPDENGNEEKSQPTAEAKSKKPKIPERGVDTIFRITSNNNQRLSTQADSKARIMIWVNSIMVTGLLSLLFRKLDEYRFLTVPTILLLAVNVVTIFFSVLATRPNIPKGTFDKSDIESKKTNLLFFGNFYKMSLEEYATGMLAMMKDYDFLYMSLIRDIYFQGKVLGKKYHLLRISYSVFMFGLIFSVIGFVVALIFFSHK